jgi:hypothetical protein
MITKKHIRQYLDKLSSGIPTKQGEMPDQVWEQYYEYIVKHYKRLDKGARAYADEIFDQLDANVKQRIDSLPDGRERKVLSRKLSVVRGERSPIPVLYLDTPVIENIIRYALGRRLSDPAAANSKALYEELMAMVKDGKLICPEDSFHREALQMGGTQAWEGLNIIRTLSEGLSFKHSQSIEDSQIFRALRGFIDGNGPVNYRKFWQDGFKKETVNAIMKKRSSTVFKGVLAISEKARPAGQQGRPEPPSTRLRIRYNEASLKNEQQLQQRSARHLRDLVRLGMKYNSMRGEAQERGLDGFWADQKIDLPVALWNYYGGKPEGLEGLASFYESEHFRDVPAIKVKRNIWHALSDHAEGSRRVTGPADVNILSSILPYADVMILGRKMTDVVRDRLELDLIFDTDICSADEHDLIMAALEKIAHLE